MKPLFSIQGKVIKGKMRGKDLGFPTANLPINSSFPEGIYISMSELDKKLYQSITFIGTVDTFGENDYVCETHLFDFHEEIYDITLTVHILRKIRDNKKFSSEKELIREIENDKIIAEQFFITEKLSIN